MSKYLIEASYTVEGSKGLLKDGGSSRRAVVEQMVKGLGGRVEGFYFAFGETDALAIIDLPDNVSAAAVGVAVAAGGGAGCKTTVLITPEEMDAATKKRVGYRPPGRAAASRSAARQPRKR